MARVMTERLGGLGGKGSAEEVGLSHLSADVQRQEERTEGSWRVQGRQTIA